MAVVRNNNLIDGISGLIGKDLLFKQINNKTFVFKRAKKPTKQSPQQKENRTNQAKPCTRSMISTVTWLKKDLAAKWM